MNASKLIPSSKESRYLFVFAFFYILPLLLANVYYMDDIFRSIGGGGWNHDGRSLSTLLFQLISSGSSLIDFFPYSTILASVILSFSGFYLSHIIGIADSKTFCFGSLLFVTSPCMLENLSFRWDCLPMSISVISVVIPFLFVFQKKKFVTFLIIGIIVTLFTYQASIVVAALIVVSLIISFCINKTLKDILYLIKYSLLSLIVAFPIYKIIEMRMQYKYYQGTETIFSTSIPFTSYYDRIMDCFMTMRIVINFPMKILFLCTFLLTAIGLVKFLFSKKDFVLKIIILASVILIPFFVFFIPSILKSSPTQLRIFLGIPFFLYAPLIFINYYSKKCANYLSIVFVLLSLPLMAAYGNALKKQNDFEKFVIKDVTSHKELGNKNLYFYGSEPWVPELNVSIQNYPIIHKLVPRYLSHFYMVGFFELHSYSTGDVFNVKPIFGNDQLKDIKKNVPILYKTNNYYVRSNETLFIVDFDKEEDIIPDEE